VTTDPSFELIERIQAAVDHAGVIYTTPARLARRFKCPEGELHQALSVLADRQTAGVDLDKRGRLTLWVKRPDAPPRKLPIAHNPLWGKTGKTLRQQQEGQAPDPEFWGQYGEIDPANPPDLDAVQSTAQGDDEPE